MPLATSGGSAVTSSNIVDLTIAEADLSAAVVAKLMPTITNLIPTPTYPYDDVSTATALTGNTTGFVGQVLVPFSITANKISVLIGLHTTTGTLKFGLFSEDGQTRIFSVTTASISGLGLVTTALSAVSIPRGIYYFVVVPVSTTNVRIVNWMTSTQGEPLSTTVTNGVTSEPDMYGTITVTADTMPTTITPASITGTDDCGVVFRLDN